MRWEPSRVPRKRHFKIIRCVQINVERRLPDSSLSFSSDFVRNSDVRLLRHFLLSADWSKDCDAVPLPKRAC